MNDQLNSNGNSATMAVEDALTRHNQNWMADGIVEIVLGSFWLLWAAAVFLPLMIHDDAAKQARLALLLLGMVAMPLALKRAIRGWKERVSFPRTGYVELRPPATKMRIAVIAVTATIAFTISLFGSNRSEWTRHWTSFGLGLLMFGSMAVTAWRVRAPRLMALSSLVLAAAVLSKMFDLSFSNNAGVLLLVYAFVSLLDGLLRLRSYLKAHPASAGDQL